MKTELNPEMRAAIHQSHNSPIKVVDPATREVYYLIPEAKYERIRALLETDDDQISDTYAAQEESLRRAGWDDPALDDYNNLGDLEQK